MLSACLLHIFLSSISSLLPGTHGFSFPNELLFTCLRPGPFPSFLSRWSLVMKAFTAPSTEPSTVGWDFTTCLAMAFRLPTSGSTSHAASGLWTPHLAHMTCHSLQCPVLGPWGPHLEGRGHYSPLRVNGHPAVPHTYHLSQLMTPHLPFAGGRTMPLVLSYPHAFIYNLLTRTAGSAAEGSQDAHQLALKQIPKPGMVAQAFNAST